VLFRSEGFQKIRGNITDLTGIIGRSRKRKCADAVGTVLVPQAGHFQC